MKKGIFFIMILLLLAACTQTDSKPKELQTDEIIKIDGQAIQTEEIAIYGIQVKKEFEQIGGADIWEFEAFSGGKSAYEVAKTKVLENLVRVKILAAKAGERKIELTAEEEVDIEKRAKDFLAEESEKKAIRTDVSLEHVKRVFTEFELGQKLKREMLRSFHPGSEMIMAKLMQDESYQELEEQKIRNKYQRFLVKVAEIEASDANQKRIEQIQNQLEQFQGLTDELSQSMVYEEYKYTKEELDTLFGENFAQDLIQRNEQFILKEDATAYLYIKLEEMQILAPDKLHSELKKAERQKRELREQAEESIRDESFDVIYKEWKKETDIQINQELWQDFVVFSLPSEQN